MNERISRRSVPGALTDAAVAASLECGGLTPLSCDPRLDAGASGRNASPMRPCRTARSASAPYPSRRQAGAEQSGVKPPHSKAAAAGGSGGGTWHRAAAAMATLMAALLLPLVARAGEPAWTALTEEQGLPGNEVQFLRAGDDGAVWIGTLSGLARYRDGKCETLLKGVEVWDLLPAGDGQFWVGTGRGVFRVGREVKGEPAPALKEYSVAPLLRVGEGKLWAIAKAAKGQQAVVAQCDGATWMPLKAFAGERLKDMFLTRDGHVWLTVEGNGVLEVPSWQTPEQTTRHLEGLDVTAFEEDARGRLWCGTWGNGLYLREKDQWQRLLQKEKAAILDVDLDSRGGVWVATNAHGLWRQDGENWVNDLADERGINLLEPTADGRVWISNQAHGGLRYWDGKAWHEALPGPLPLRCLLETKDALWAGGVLDGVHLRQK